MRQSFLVLSVLALFVWAGPVQAQDLDECFFPALEHPGDGSIIIDTQTVAGSVTITELNMYMNITTGWVGDWDNVTLNSPGGSSVTVQFGGGGFASDFDLNYSDVGLVNDGIAGATGTGVPSIYDCGGCLYQPAGPGTMADFDGELSDGDWELSLDSFEIGTLNQWCVRNYPVAPVNDLVCSTDVDTDADDVPDTAGAAGEFSITAVAGADYDSIEVRNAGAVIATLAGPILTGESIYLDNVGAGVPTPQLANLQVVGIVGVDDGAPNFCSLAFPSDPVVTVSASPAYTIDAASPPYIGILEFDAAFADEVINDIQVGVDVTYPFIGNLDISVGSNSGTSVLLHDRNGGFDEDINVTYWELGLANGGGTPIVADTSPYNCACFMQPSGPGALLDFVGEEVGNLVGGVENTAWAVTILTSATDVGTVNEVSISIFDDGPAFAPTVDLCEAGAALNSLDVTWTNGSDYGTITITVNGDVLLTDDGTLFDLTGGVSNITTISDLDVPGVYTVEFTGTTLGGAPGPVSSCTTQLTLPGITGLSCSSVSGTGTVDVSWTNGAAYDEIDVVVDGVLDSTLVGGESTISLPGPFLIPSTVVVELTPRILACSGVGAADPCDGDTVTCSALVLGGVDIEVCEVAPGGLLVELTVLDSQTIEETQVLMDTTSDFVSGDDMDITSPAGTSVRLHDFGGPTVDSNQLLVWDDVAGIAFDANDMACACLMNTQGPGDLTDFTNEVSDGIWQYNHTAFGVATVNQVCVRINGCPTLPPSTVAAAVTDEPAGEITVTWVNESAYDDVEVFRDGLSIAILPGGDESFVDTVPDLQGRYRYSVSGFSTLDACGGTSEEVSVTIGIDETCIEDVALGTALETLTITVLDPVQIGDVQFVLDYTNAWSPFTLGLESPSGTSVQMWGVSEDLAPNGNNLNVIFADGGAVIPGAAPFPAGSVYAPFSGSFSDYEFEVADGDWIVSHTSSFAGATLNQACVAIFEGCTVAPPSGLIGTVVDNDIEWSWTNNGTYFDIDVEINGEVVANIDGAETTYVQETVPAGFYTLRLFAQADDGGAGCTTGSANSDEVQKGIFAVCEAPVADNDISSTLPADEQIVNITGGPDSVDEVQVRIAITHTFQGDLEIDVANPGGTSVRLHDQQGGSADNFDVTYSDFGDPNLGTGYADGLTLQPFDTFNGNATLADLIDDLDPTFPDGDWVITTADLAGGDDGTFDEGCIILFEGCPIGRPDAVTCTNAAGLYPVELTWINTDTYDELNVLRNGVLVATLPGGDETYTDNGPALATGGDVNYQIVAVSVADDCVRASFLCQTQIGRRDICSTESVDLDNTGVELSTIDWEAEDLRLADTDGQDSVDIEEAQILIDLTTTFVGNFDFNVFSPAGTGVLVMNNNGGLTVDCRIIFDDDGQPAFNLNGTNNLTDPPTQFAPSTIGQELAAWDGENAEGDWLLVGLTTGDPGTLNEWCVQIFPDDIVGVVGDTFIRGDADGNGSFNALLDALRILDFAFGSAAAPPCLKAADADGNGVFNALLDALRILDFAFGGAAAPPAPFPDCGVDTAGLSDAVSCETSTICP